MAFVSISVELEIRNIAPQPKQKRLVGGTSTVQVGQRDIGWISVKHTSRRLWLYLWADYHGRRRVSTRRKPAGGRLQLIPSKQEFRRHMQLSRVTRAGDDSEVGGSENSPRE